MSGKNEKATRKAKMRAYELAEQLMEGGRPPQEAIAEALSVVTGEPIGVTRRFVEQQTRLKKLELAELKFEAPKPELADDGTQN